MEMKNEEEKNQLPVKLFFYHFHVSESSSILEHYSIMKEFSKEVLKEKF